MSIIIVHKGGKVSLARQDQERTTIAIKEHQGTEMLNDGLKKQTNENLEVIKKEEKIVLVSSG